MPKIKIEILGKDRDVAAMVKALAVSTSGYQAVSGAKNDFLDDYGYLEFNFSSYNRMKEFIGKAEYYLESFIIVIKE